MRARIPHGKGLWPAFWLLPADMSWPPEIDVMESIGDARRVYMTTHSAAQPAKGGEASVEPGVFHTFAVSWDAKQVVWYIDGREAKRDPTPPDLHKPMFLLANLAVGGSWPGMPDERTAFPAALEIDAIRAYQFAP
jgi:beta-glucanase (GH16 family)